MFILLLYILIFKLESVDVILNESARESPTLKEAIIATLSDDLALPIGSLSKVSAHIGSVLPSTLFLFIARCRSE